MAPVQSPAGGIVSDSYTAFTVSTEFYDLKDFVYAIAEGLAGDLGKYAGMAGDDSTAHKFAAKYQPTAVSVVKGIGDAGQSLATTASKLLVMAVNYLNADDSAAARLGGTVDTAAPTRPTQQECDPNEAYASLPMVTGSKQVHEIPLIGHFWPQGDPDKLRAAATVWAKAATLIDDAQRQAGTYVVAVTSTSSGAAVDAFATYVRSIFASHPSGGTGIAAGAPLMENLSAACRVMGQICHQYADAIDTLRTTLIAIGATITAATAIGIALTFFTFGGSDAAAAAADAAAVADAGAAAETFAAAEESLAAAAAVEEAEAIISAELQRLTAAGVITTTVVATTVVAAGAALAAPGTTTLTSVVPPTPPMPPSGLYPPLTPAQQAAAAAWAGSLPNRPPNYGTPDDIAYQIQVAGAPELRMPTDDGRVVWVDGFRVTDGGIIEAKHVRDPSCTPRTLDGLNSGSFKTGFVITGDDDEINRIAHVISDPRNQAKYVEIDCSDPSVVGYFQYLARANHAPYDVRYVP